MDKYLADYSSDLMRVWETERAFELHLEKGIVSGRADVILDREGGKINSLALVDYKTANDPKADDIFAFQLAVYAAAGRGEGLNVDAAYLHHLNAAQRRDVPVDGQVVKEARERADTLIEGIVQGTSRPDLKPRNAVGATCGPSASTPNAAGPISEWNTQKGSRACQERPDRPENRWPRMSEKLAVAFSTKTILDIRNLQEQGHLNLEPGFQRKSVWNGSDRKKLIQSVLQGLPLPSIFLYRREDEQGNLIYDVLDGKQRLETLFMFMRIRPFSKMGFEVPFQFTEDEEPDKYDWRTLDQNKRISPVLAYNLQVAEVSGPFADIVELFVRINSTGKALTTSERRHARFYTSPFLKEAERLARRNRDFLADQRIISAVGVDRMKDVELVSELIASILANGPIHKKQAVDRAISNSAVHRRTLDAAVEDFGATLRAIKQLFPDLYATRFQNVSEFYSLFLVVWELIQQKLVLKDRRRNDIAMKLLRHFSNGVDEVREQQRRGKGALPHQQTYLNYLLLVQQSTDALGQRQRRAAMLRDLFAGLFEAKDERRLFTEEQRRLLWNSSEEKVCSLCGEPLTWANFQVDHILAHSRGGRTDRSNTTALLQLASAA